MHTAGTHQGTPGYMAPEMMRVDERQYDEKVYIWSTGVIIYEMAGKKLPVGIKISLIVCCW